MEDEAVIAGRERPGCSRDRVVADTRTLARRRRQARASRNSSGEYVLSVLEAAVASRERRVGVPVEPAARIGRDIERSLRDREVPIGITEVVVPRDPAGADNRVWATADGARRRRRRITSRSRTKSRLGLTVLEASRQMREGRIRIPILTALVLRRHRQMRHRHRQVPRHIREVVVGGHPIRTGDVVRATSNRARRRRRRAASHRRRQNRLGLTVLEASRQMREGRIRIPILTALVLRRHRQMRHRHRQVPRHIREVVVGGHPIRTGDVVRATSNRARRRRRRAASHRRRQNRLGLTVLEASRQMREGRIRIPILTALVLRRHRQMRHRHRQVPRHIREVVVGGHPIRTGDVVRATSNRARRRRRRAASHRRRQNRLGLTVLEASRQMREGRIRIPILTALVLRRHRQMRWVDGQVPSDERRKAIVAGGE